MKKIILLKKLFLFLLFFIFIYICISLFIKKNIFADSFYPYGMVSNCKFASTSAVQFNKLPYDIQYNKSHLHGKSGNWIQSHDIFDVADISYPNARRYPFVADYVSVPPKTQIDIGLFAWNYSSHTIDTNKVIFFTSQSNPQHGDLTKLGAKGTYGYINFDHGNAFRQGKYITAYNLGSFAHRYPHKGRIFYSFQTIQPIKYIDRKIESIIDNSNSLKLKISLTLKNISKYNVCNIQVSDKLPGGETYNNKICLNSNQSKTLTYYSELNNDFEENIQISGAQISDPNRYKESNASHYSNPNDIYNYNARSTYVSRNDSYDFNWFAYQPGWGQEQRDLITVEIIPYSFITPNQNIKIEPKLSIEKFVSDTDEFEQKTTNSHQNEELLYKINIKNSGSKIQNINVIDEFNKNFLEIVPNQNLIIENNKIIWNINEISFNEIKEITFKAKIKNNLSIGNHTIENFVSIKYNDQIISDQVNSQLKIYPDLELEKNVENITFQNNNWNNSNNHNTEIIALADNKLKYTIKYRNIGNTSINNIIIRDILPKYLIENNKKITIFDINSINTKNAQIINKNNNIWIEWDINNLEVSDQWHKKDFTIEINKNLNSDVLKIINNKTIWNNAQIITQNPLVENIQTKVKFTLEYPDLEIYKNILYEKKEAYTIGDEINFEIIIKNKGKGYARDIQIIDILNKNLKFISHNFKDQYVSFNNAKNKLIFNINELAPNHIKIIQINTQIIPINNEKITIIKNIAQLKSRNENKKSSNEVEKNILSSCITGIISINNYDQNKIFKEKIKNNQISINLNWNSNKKQIQKSYILNKHKIEINALPINKNISAKLIYKNNENKTEILKTFNNIKLTTNKCLSSLDFEINSDKITNHTTQYNILAKSGNNLFMILIILLLILLSCLGLYIKQIHNNKKKK